MQTNPSPTWDDLRVLLALHRHRSFLAAGKALGVSTSTAARRIDALESSLGRPLVHRSSGGTLVEPDALELVALAEQLELGLRAVRRDEGDHEVSGTVRISMGEGFIQPVTHVLSGLLRSHPSLQLEIISESRNVDLARRESDICIRKTRSSSPVVVERAVGRLSFGLYAAQSYIDRRLRSGSLTRADLARHDYVVYDGPVPVPTQTQWLVNQGATRFVFRSNSSVALIEATLAGNGIVILPDASVRSLAGLIRLGIDPAPPSLPIFLAFHRDLRRVPRIRLVLDVLDAALRDGLR
jgi:DNA-binding transcriptional LysR family regulator